MTFTLSRRGRDARCVPRVRRVAKHCVPRTSTTRVSLRHDAEGTVHAHADRRRWCVPRTFRLVPRFPLGDSEFPLPTTQPPTSLPDPFLLPSIGQIWSKRPDVQADGLISVVRSGVNRTSFASAAWTRSADSVASVDTRGNVYAFHIRKNRYQLLSREGDEGTAVCCNEKEVLSLIHI